jgi:hypothetical protein
MNYKQKTANRKQAYENYIQLLDSLRFEEFPEDLIADYKAKRKSPLKQKRLVSFVLTEYSQYKLLVNRVSSVYRSLFKERATLKALQELNRQGFAITGIRIPEEFLMLRKNT